MTQQIQAVLIGEFEQSILMGAEKSLADADNPLRLTNYANAMRELSRHILHRLAPEESVKQCNWFDGNDGDPNELTRRHRARYVVQGGLSQEFAESVLALEVEISVARLISTIGTLNQYTRTLQTIRAINARKHG